MEIQNIEKFISQLLVENGIINLEPDIEADIKEEMEAIFIDQIVQVATARLSEEKAAELAQKLEDPEFTKEKLIDFLQKSGIDLTEIMLETMIKYRNLYLGKEVPNVQ